MNEYQPTYEEKEKGYQPSRESVTRTENPIIIATTPLLMLFPLLRSTSHFDNIQSTRNKILTEIKEMQNKLEAFSYSNNDILIIRYCMCTALDEALLSNADQSAQPWSTQSLLSTIHNETWGGNRFYLLLEHCLQNPEKNIHMLDFFYALINLGFKGKYYDNYVELSNIRSDLHNILHEIKPKIKETISPEAPSYTPPWNLYDFMPLWLLALITFVFLFMMDIGISYYSVQRFVPVYSTLHRISNPPYIVDAELSMEKK